MAVVVVLKSQKEECHPGEDIFNASFHNDIKITTITWDSPNTANIVPFGGDWGGGGGGAELKESPSREYCQCFFQTSQELRMLSMSLSDCRSLLLNLNLNLNCCLSSDCSDCSDCSAIVVLL